VPEGLAPIDEKLRSGRISGDASAVTVGLLYHDHEVQAVPMTWQAVSRPGDPWGAYARAYHELNQALDFVRDSLAIEFGGVSERATIDGWSGRVQHVGDYYAHCISHRAFAEAAGLGWRGRHGLIVTTEAGAALRLATIFLNGHVEPRQQRVAGCGDCFDCLEVCPVLRQAADYREACRRHINALGLEADVCGICVRVCWERVTRNRRDGGKCGSGPFSTLGRSGT